MAIFSAFDMTGRILFPALSDFFKKKKICRKYSHNHRRTLRFRYCLRVFEYGGTFGSLSGCLADLFGAENVGSIFGVSLSAWAMSGLLFGPIIAEIRKNLIQNDGDLSALYFWFYTLAAVPVVIGFIFSVSLQPFFKLYGTPSDSPLELVDIRVEPTEMEVDEAHEDSDASVRKRSVSCHSALLDTEDDHSTIEPIPGDEESHHGSSSESV
ncbi:hypothetical protein GEMRC1_013728 [Eukaryota sp. GEM-RC1]